MRCTIDNEPFEPARLALEVFAWDRAEPSGSHKVVVELDREDLAAIGARFSGHLTQLEAEEPGSIAELRVDGYLVTEDPSAFARQPALAIAYLADDYWRSCAVRDALWRARGDAKPVPPQISLCWFDDGEEVAGGVQLRFRAQASADALEPRTWRRKSGLASWTFKASPHPAESLRAGTAAVLRALDGFATLVRVSYSTCLDGEDAAVLSDAAHTQDRARVDAEFARLPEVSAVFFNLDLQVLDEDGGEVVVRRGGSLWMDVDDWNGAPTLSAYLDLDVDLYAPRTWGPERDNAALAARNAPRLAAFLQRLRDELGATEVLVDAPDYDGATPAGFQLT